MRFTQVLTSHKVKTARYRNLLSSQESLAYIQIRNLQVNENLRNGDFSLSDYLKYLNKTN